MSHFYPDHVGAREQCECSARQHRAADAIVTGALAVKGPLVQAAA